MTGNPEMSQSLETHRQQKQLLQKKISRKHRMIKDSKE